MMEIKIIGLSGQMQNGKDSVADLILKLTSGIIPHSPYDDGLLTSSIWKTKRFAGILKEMTALLIGCNINDLEDNEFKNTPLSEDWRRWYYQHYKVVSDSNPKGIVSPYFSSREDALNYEKRLAEFVSGYQLIDEILTPRLILQLLGTEGGRDVIHPNIWVNSTLGRLKDTDKVIVTDCRFINEVEGIRKRGGIVIRVVRPSIISTSTHPSEISLNDYNDWDYKIINDGSLEDLERKVKEMLLHFKIIS